MTKITIMWLLGFIWWTNMQIDMSLKVQTKLLETISAQEKPQAKPIDTIGVIMDQMKAEQLKLEAATIRAEARTGEG